MILRIGYLNSVSAVCQLNFVDGHKLFNFSLASPLPKFPHGVLSEDGFYKVAVNESVLWFEDCGGPLHYGMECSALVTDNIGDERNPQKGVIVKMSNTVKTSTGSKNCSLNVSVICDSNGVQAAVIQAASFGLCHCICSWEGMGLVWYLGHHYLMSFW
ncbi:uncharacterized protein LOC122724062 isoform X1 [Manihot esculenta]|uniref:Uncharacterized protein n=1 Tax=Manihot esculenta TaxID=3983 RepID=A0ACB7HI82_MANES|nr:uncharacterized protein LOC122724062 isoform X1 [Manihot esculenta]KAG8651503.1 hypothetical protein MANES_07G134901v8 [Manihot esculenta]